MTNTTVASTALEHVVAGIETQTAYGLANDVKHACSTEEAAAFYTHVRDCYAEALKDGRGTIDLNGGCVYLDDDAINEIADGAPDAYNYTRMMEAIGTGAYLDESELVSDREDMVTLAGYVLCELASAVLSALDEIASGLVAEWAESQPADDEGADA